MKRGWITWDRTELPPTVFQERLDRVRKFLAERDLPALVVYSDVARSNAARYLTNFMPYWNRALLVVAQQGPPTLICALSARVYPWIRSVTMLEDIRPGTNPVRQLLALSSERHWQRIGVWDLPRLPHDLYRALSQAGVEVIDVPAPTAGVAVDERELAMRRSAAKIAREILAEELPRGAGLRDFDFAGRLERKFRRAGAEDLVILVSDGSSAPLPAKGAILPASYSVMVGVEYRGHWVRLSRPQTSRAGADSMRNSFNRLLKNPSAPADTAVYAENLSGPYPYESCDRSEIGPGSIFALHVESREHDRRLFYGDTCWFGERGAEPL